MDKNCHIPDLVQTFLNVENGGLNPKYRDNQSLKTFYEFVLHRLIHSPIPVKFITVQV